MEKVQKNLLDNKLVLLFISLVYFVTVIRSGSLIWMTFPLYLMIIARYVIKSEVYDSKLYMLSIFLLILLEGLLLIYIYLFDSVLLKIPENQAMFFVIVIVTIMVLFVSLRLIITGEYKKLPK